MHLSRVNLPALIAQWARAVADFERHRDVDGLSAPGWLEMQADLVVRHEIAQRLRARSTTAETRDLLAELDTAFRAATIEAAGCLHGDEVALANDWTPRREWYYWRVPRVQLP